MPRKTDEEVYIDEYITYLASFAPKEVVMDWTPEEYPPLTSKIPELSNSTLFLNRHLRLTPYAKEALYIKTGFVFTTKVILTEKAYYKNSRALRQITLQSVHLRNHGQFSATIPKVHDLFTLIRKLHHRELSTFTTYKEPKKKKNPKSPVRSENTTKKKGDSKTSLSVDEILDMY